MLDKQKKSAYIWYSGATDITGTKLAEALGIEHGKDKPVFSKYDLIIGWGTKVNQPIAVNKIQTINHPNKIFSNRNKLESLAIMQKAGVSIANFIDAHKVVTDISNPTGVHLPLIGRTNYHQGGKGFWICPALVHVKAAINDGAQYFQDMIEIKEEYRLHVFDNEIIYAVKKSKRSKEEYQEAYIQHELDHQKKLAKKNNNLFDETTAKLILTRMAKKEAANGADMIIRSNKKGWKFSHIKVIKDDLRDEAIKALKALELNFGAVDCCIDINNKVYIIEINTGPGLEETTFATYVAAFKKMMIKHKNPITTKIKGPIKSTRDEMLAKTMLMTELVEKADESEAKALKSVFEKMFR